MTRHTPTRPCFWPQCMNEALTTMPICLHHAWEVVREYERTVGRPGQHQTAGTIGEPVVYYIETRPGIIKIGTTAALRDRVRSLRCDMSDIRALEPGGFPKEHHRHLEFAHLRRGKREDFDLTPQLQAHIDLILKTFGTPDDVMESIRRANRERLAENRTKR